MTKTTNDYRQNAISIFQCKLTCVHMYEYNIYNEHRCMEINKLQLNGYIDTV